MCAHFQHLCIPYQEGPHVLTDIYGDVRRWREDNIEDTKLILCGSVVSSTNVAIWNVHVIRNRNVSIMSSSLGSCNIISIKRSKVKINTSFHLYVVPLVPTFLNTARWRGLVFIARTFHPIRSPLNLTRMFITALGSTRMLLPW